MINFFGCEVGYYRLCGLADMADAIAQDRPHRASAEMALHVMEVIEAIRISGETGQGVDIASRCERPAPITDDIAGRCRLSTPLEACSMPALSFEQACALTAGAAMWKSVAVPEAGIPSFTMGDGPMGIASGNVDERDVSLLSPCATALGASWDVEVARKVGSVVGSDAVARGIDAVLAPNLNLARSPLAGRAFEYFSEDPLLAGVLGAAWIAGLQSTGTGAVPKHLVCNDSETGRDYVNVRVDERTLREVYLLPFELAAEAGCAGMLAAYNKVNGNWCSESAHVLTDIVKGEWGFDKLIMSDWFGTHSSDGTINAGPRSGDARPGAVHGAEAGRG